MPLAFQLLPVAARRLDLVVVMAVGSLVYGFYTFPDGPIRETRTGYAGKTGTAYPREHYERFKLWEKTIVGVFVSVFAIGGALVVEERIRKRRGMP